VGPVQPHSGGVTRKVVRSVTHVVSLNHVVALTVGLYHKLHGVPRPVAMKKTVIKRRKRVPAVGSSTRNSPGGPSHSEQTSPARLNVPIPQTATATGAPYPTPTESEKSHPSPYGAPPSLHETRSPSMFDPIGMRRQQQKAVPLNLSKDTGGERKKPWWFDDKSPANKETDGKDDNVSSFLLLTVMAVPLTASPLSLFALHSLHPTSIVLHLPFIWPLECKLTRGLFIYTTPIRSLQLPLKHSSRTSLRPKRSSQWHRANRPRQEPNQSHLLALKTPIGASSANLMPNTVLRPRRSLRRPKSPVIKLNFFEDTFRHPPLRLKPLRLDLRKTVQRRLKQLRLLRPGSRQIGTLSTDPLAESREIPRGTRSHNDILACRFVAIRQCPPRYPQLLLRLLQPSRPRPVQRSSIHPDDPRLTPRAIGSTRRQWAATLTIPWVVESFKNTASSCARASAGWMAC
jgi:hypothetical protein